jgi:hypothetical protein
MSQNFKQHWILKKTLKKLKFIFHIFSSPQKILPIQPFLTFVLTFQAQAAQQDSLTNNTGPECKFLNKDG